MFGLEAGLELTFRPANLEKCPPNVPVKENSRDISIQDLVAKAETHSGSQSFSLQFGDRLSMRSRMKRTNSKRCRSWSREDETLPNDKVFPERDHEEDTKVSARHGKGNQSSQRAL
jgi:hypothetical protein